MAELIPLKYRVRVASRHRLERWIFWGILILAMCSASLLSTYAWQLRSSGELTDLRTQYKSRSALITRSQELRSKRLDLAQRMQKIQYLMDDRLLLALLNGISQGFSSGDCLEFIHIDAQSASTPANKKSPQPTDASNRYRVHITGITTNSTSLAELMTRLSKTAQPRMNVTLESSKRENFLDGQVMRFQIVCEHTPGKG